jgi:hypothetical protein
MPSCPHALVPVQEKPFFARHFNPLIRVCASFRPSLLCHSHGFPIQFFRLLHPLLPLPVTPSHPLPLCPRQLLVTVERVAYASLPCLAAHLPPPLAMLCPVTALLTKALVHLVCAMLVKQEH